MSDFRIDKITNRDGSAGTQICGVSTFSGTTGMVMPGGPTEYRGGRGRGVYTGGTSPDTLQGVNSMSYIEIATTGNAADFGDITSLRSQLSCGGSSTRGVLAGGYGPAAPSPGTGLTQIDYMTFSSQGGAVHFGDLILRRHAAAVANDSTRMLNIGGNTSPATSAGDKTNLMEFITIASTGDASDFGDLPIWTTGFVGSANSPTRGITLGGQQTPYDGSSARRTCYYVNIQTTGDALDFGDLTVRRRIGAEGVVCSTTRGIAGGAYDSPTNLNTIDYITMATLGNAVDFGDMTTAMRAYGGCSSLTRGVFCYGHTQNSPNVTNVMEYLTISTTGNTTDFGDNTWAGTRASGCSDSHGGLG